MKEISIYVEGGGDTAQQKAELRNGFDQLWSAQKQAAQSKRLRWKTVPSGDRQRTYDAFANRMRNGDEEVLCILLVDSEDELPPELPRPTNEAAEAEGKRKHANAQRRKDLLVNHDQWDLKGISPDCLHLMVQLYGSLDSRRPGGACLLLRQGLSCKEPAQSSQPRRRAEGPGVRKTQQGDDGYSKGRIPEDQACRSTFGTNCPK